MENKDLINIFKLGYRLGELSNDVEPALNEHLEELAKIHINSYFALNTFERKRVSVQLDTINLGNWDS